MSALAHERAGAGPRAVLLLHGLLGSARNLRALAERDTSLGVVALDLTGHGGSPPLPPGADTATLARDVLDTARGLDLAGALTLVGHSLGGRIALRAARLAPGAIAAITLLDVAPGASSAGDGVTRILEVLRRAPVVVASRAQGRAHLIAGGLPPALADWLSLNLEPTSAGHRWRVDREALAALHARSAGEDLWPAVEGPRAYAVRCVRGGASQFVSAADARRLEAAGCPVATIEGAGHLLHVERPYQVLEAVMAGLLPP